MKHPDLYVKATLKRFGTFTAVSFLLIILLSPLIGRSALPVYYFSGTELIIAAVAVIVLLIVSYIIGKKKQEKAFAKLLGESILREKQTADKLSAAQLYNSAWFFSIVDKCRKEIEREEAREREVWSKGGHIDRWGHPDPEDALKSEHEMIYRCSKADTEYEAVTIISSCVPKTIGALMDSQEYIDELSKKDRKMFKALCEKYCIPERRRKK